jgi:hypothetical protein
MHPPCHQTHGDRKSFDPMRLRIKRLEMKQRYRSTRGNRSFRFRDSSGTSIVKRLTKKITPQECRSLQCTAASSVSAPEPVVDPAIGAGTRRPEDKFKHNPLLSVRYSIRARVAKLADAPDLGFRNRRFQNVALRFKKQSIYERKTRFFMIGVAFTTDE